MNLKKRLDTLKSNGLYRTMKVVDKVHEQYIFIENEKFINFTSNDYLGLSQLSYHTNEIDSFINQYSANLSSSRLISGNSIAYKNIESEISENLGFERCLILNSGYDANLSVFNIFKNENITVFSDEKNHASIIDGIKLSGLNKMIYKHLDYNDLETKLSASSTEDNLIVIDSVFSTNGDKANIDKLIELKRKYNALLFIDDSHNLGLDNFKNYEGIDILTSSLSKAWGAHGGIVLSSNLIIELIINHGRPLIYSSGLPNFDLFSIKKNFEYIISDNLRSDELKSIIHYFNKTFNAMFTEQSFSSSPIKSIVFSDIQKAEATYKMLFKKNILVSFLRYPTVDKPAIRISLSYFHSKKDIDVLLQLIKNFNQGDI